MSRIDGVTIARRRAQRERDLAEPFVHQRVSIYDQEPPREAKGIILLAIAIVATVVITGLFV